ncbi:hypothetical protein BGW36DRAFT_365661 [Talaromyces proteolyticus]|uniref:Uncharacterized protein n=1 Tax=Talaromyces proteolyticus TaxID=1131652 RepID=A0AAD4KEH3_9EURO|nr:uncharacterized protein BGW36DRAFT_365661 [Talaromyces proteolyticus]KAH8689130.1 hypothetical protein BGW36DRAFT_365661 [Talaromyces proteolyticus]
MTLPTLSVSTSMSTSTQSTVTASTTATPAIPCSPTDRGHLGNYVSRIKTPSIIFWTECFTDYPNGGPGVLWDMKNVPDLLVLATQTFDGRMDECVVYNAGLPPTPSPIPCNAVVYNWESTGSNCWLKNDIPEQNCVYE